MRIEVLRIEKGFVNELMDNLISTYDFWTILRLCSQKKKILNTCTLNTNYFCLRTSFLVQRAPQRKKIQMCGINNVD